MPKIAVIGAGVAGMTVAHECAERGCEVVVFEKADIVGGKAATDLYQGMPRDHATKNISPYYHCLIEQLKRIPIGDKTVYDELMPRKTVALCAGDKTLVMDTRLSLSSRLKRLIKIYRFYAQLVPKKELLRFARVIFRYIFSTAKQRKKLDQTNILELLQFKETHPLAIIFEGIAVADIRGSALMYVDQFLRQVLTIYNPYRLEYLSNYFIKPASDSFLIPWRQHLEKLGVKFNLNSEITRLEHEGNHITALQLKKDRYDDFDVYVIATDVPGLRRINDASQLNLPCLADPSAPFDNKACGFFIAMSDLPEGYVSGRLYIELEHPWSIVTIFYTINEITSAEYFPENCKAYVWFSLGNMVRKGKIINKILEEATQEEVCEELISALRFSGADRAKIIASYWGRTVMEATKKEALDGILNQMATVYSRPVNPTPIPNRTQYGNLLLAGEFTDTLQKAATMEKANEAGKRCTKQLLAMFNMDYPDEKFQYKYLPLQDKRELL